MAPCIPATLSPVRRSLWPLATDGCIGARYADKDGCQARAQPARGRASARTIADELDKRSTPLPDEVAAKLIPLVSGSRIAPARLMELLEAADRKSVV